KFLPDYPNAEAAEKVSVRQLLNMTSGIGDFFGERYDATPKEKILTLRDYLALFGDQPLEFEPGTSNKYSNGGYIVLGLIIEKLSGVDYYAYVRENIFKPCGMADTDAFPRAAGTPNLARGYTREGEEAGGARVLNFATLPGRGSSAGGGYSTAGDMLKFALAVKDKKIVLPDADSGLGVAGGAPGINSVLEWDPQSGFIVIVLTNFDPPTAGQAARRIAAWLPQ
ncbi:MAG: serine hydrolase domain-containing protein, partial [Candidatus Aminicenantales bacterium]